MTDRFYGADLGDTMQEEITEATTTTSKVVELRVEYDAAGLTKTDVLLAIESIKQRISQKTWPPV